MTLIAPLLLSVLPAHGLWFLVFRTPLLPHLAGLLWRQPFMTSEDLSLQLLTRGYDKLFFLWVCTYCQATWTSLLAAIPLAWLLSPALGLGLGSVGWLAPVLWLSLLPLFWLLQKPFGHNTLPAEAPAAAPAPAVDAAVTQDLLLEARVLLPEKASTAVTRQSRKLTPEENLVMSFFGLGPCGFEGCEEMKEAYLAARAVMEKDPDCPPCKMGGLVREYREKLRIHYGYSKDQVPDLLTGPTPPATPPRLAAIAAESAAAEAGARPE